MNSVRILVVDDDRDFAESLSDVFTMRGHDVFIVTTGEEAVERLTHEKFDIAFMDVKLPGITGVEAFLKARRAQPEVRAVMMTGYSVEQLLTQAIDEGAEGVLHKPFDVADVLQMLRRAIPASILVVDDDPDVLEAMQTVLEQAGYVVDIARTGREAIDRIRDDGIDLLVLDLRLPVVDGLNVYLELKRSGHSIPTVIVTGFAREESRTLDTLRDLSVSGVLKKPFDPRELLHTVEQTVYGAG